MIRIGLHSDDRTLQPLLASALGKDYQVRLASDEASVNRLLAAGGCDVLILDLEAHRDSLDERIESCKRAWIISRVDPPRGR